MGNLRTNSTRILLAFVLGIMIFILTLITLLLRTGAIYVNATTQDQNINQITDDMLADNSVIVVLDEEVSEINKIHSPDFFKGVEIVKILDLTKRKNNLNNGDKSFRQILQIYLKYDTKEEVLNAAKKLTQIHGVVSANPNYALEPATVPNDTFF